ncbi:VacJ family lipoprotein [Herminiimonas sp. CN]|uniref:MlaA family lipoprotein n=1 Tax=Herminiimonas sp. CN TaxID=1349818 RepID=UPI000473E924|nr:VacJ family lipoprotein [Herminiimonas sp. CN]
MKIARRITLRITTLGIALALAGCATGSDPKDPLENFNRAMFSFNDKLDQVALKPAATVYQDVLPSFVQTGIGNFFGNIGDVWTAVNNLLQGKLENGMTDIMRVAINSTMGFLGVLDIGSEAGLPKHREDFGQTLGVWGLTSGPYVVLPVFGPSTVRDTAAFPVDFSADLWGYKDPVNVRNIGTGVRLIDQRAALLGASSLIEDAALDKYAFTRDAYLQRRQSLINDGREKDEGDY